MSDRVTQLRVELLLDDRAFILHDFSGPLTIAQGMLFSDPNNFLFHLDLYDSIARGKWQSYVVDLAARWPVQFHANNLLLLDVRWGHCDKWSLDALNNVLSKWLTTFDWSPDRQLYAQETESNRLVEDGFVRCMRIVADEANPPFNGDDRIRFGALLPIAGSVFDIIANFMQRESQRSNELFADCDDFLRETYAAVPREKRTHAGFAVLEQFDDGVTRLECAGTIISPTELRFWSRVACYHK